jgi:serine/threonine protein kinase/WD40 repeat protein
MTEEDPNQKQNDHNAFGHESKPVGIPANEFGDSVLDRSPGCPRPTRAEIRILWSPSIPPDAQVTMTLKPPTGDKPTVEAGSGHSVELHQQTVVNEGELVDTPVHYELLRILGKGGMGVVYEARQTSADRSVALKMLEKRLLASAEHKRHFISEALSTADLDHPNIVPLYDLGTDDNGTLFYTMKVVQGTSWQEVIGEKSLKENLDILMRVSDAVAFAHSRGVIHRDLKPENVMLGDFGEVLLMDWGLAASISDQAKAERLDPGRSIGGTPCYMAPEMAAGDTAMIGVCSDVYLLGAVLYEVITGKMPHTGEDVTDCLLNASNNVIQDTEDSGELVAIAMKAMATDPSERHANVRALQTDVSQYQEHAESLDLAHKGGEELLRARKSAEYELYAQAVAAYQNSLRLWSGNKHAQTGLREARLAYASCAYERGDLDLASSLLDHGDESHAKLAERVEAARWKRAKRHRLVAVLRGAVLGVAAVLLVVLITAFLWIRAERERAVQERRKAEAAARTARYERNRAVAARDRAEHESYRHQIALVEEFLRRGDLSQAQRALEDLPPRLRNWEWGYLDFKCMGGPVRYKGRESRGPAFSPVQSVGYTDRNREVSLTYGRDDFPFLKRGYDTAGFCYSFLTVEQLRGIVFSDGGELGIPLATHTVRYPSVIYGFRHEHTLVKFEKCPIPVVSAALSGNGAIVATGHTNGVVRVWTTKDGKSYACRDTFQAGRLDVATVAIAQSGNMVLARGSEGEVTVWNASTRKVVRTIRPCRHDLLLDNPRASLGPCRFGLAPNGKTMCSVTGDGVLRCWSVDSGKMTTSTKVVRTQPIMASTCRSKHGVFLVPDDTSKALVEDPRVCHFRYLGDDVLWVGGVRPRLIDATSGQVTEYLTPSGVECLSSGVAKSGKVWFGSFWLSNTVVSAVSSLADGRLVTQLKNIRGIPCYPCFSPDESRLATYHPGGRTPFITVWDSTAGEAVLTVDVPLSRWAEYTSFSPVGTHLLITARNVRRTPCTTIVSATPWWGQPSAESLPPSQASTHGVCGAGHDLRPKLKSWLLEIKRRQCPNCSNGGEFPGRLVCQTCDGKGRLPDESGRPICESYRTSSHRSKISLTFTSTGGGLNVKGETLLGFSIAGEDKAYIPAQARISGDNVIVWNDAIQRPKYVRYTPRDGFVGGLFGANGKPALPFPSGRKTTCPDCRGSKSTACPVCGGDGRLE